MEYARLQTCPTTDLRFAFLEHKLCEFATFFAIGRPIEGFFPSDPNIARCALDSEFPGVEMPDLLGNTRGVLVVSTHALEVFAKASLELGAHDTCAFTTIGHDGLLHGRNHQFLNPHGGIDVAHSDSDFRRYKKSQKIYGSKRWVLDAKKLLGKPDLIRSEQVPGHYFVSQRLIDVVEQEALSNFEFIEVEHA